MVEAGVPNAREIECAVLGNDEPEASVPGEIIPSREFYDYEAKYLDDGFAERDPGRPSRGHGGGRCSGLSIAAFRAIDARRPVARRLPAAARHRRDLVNEINTMPGFTTISMYSKMWEASGVGYAALVDRLIQLALERHAEKQRLRTSVL